MQAESLSDKPLYSRFNVSASMYMNYFFLIFFWGEVQAEALAQVVCNSRFNACVSRYSQFTGFTGTKVQILTQKAALVVPDDALAGSTRRLSGIQFTCFTGTKVQILTLRPRIPVSDDALPWATRL